MKILMQSIKKKSRSKIGLVCVLAIAALYAILDENESLSEQARHLMTEEEVLRDLRTKDLGDGECEVNPTVDGDPAPSNATKTLLASYPGSGRF